MQSKLIALVLSALSLAAAAPAFAQACDGNEGFDTVLFCNKTLPDGTEWHLNLVDRGNTGNWALCATRGDRILYSEQPMFQQPGTAFRLRSQLGTITLDVNGGDGHFRSERFGYDVDGLSCLFAM
jgi:hypothetical protein